MITASKGATQIPTPGVRPHGEELNSAVVAPDVAAAQVLPVSHRFSQCDVIRADGRLGAVVLMPIWRNFEEVPDRDRPKAKFSGTVAMLFFTTSSTFWTLTRPASARLFYAP